MRVNKVKKRLFLALWPDDDVRNQLTTALKGAGHSILSSGAPVKPENLHMTLLFLGDVSSSESVNLMTSLDSVSFQPFGMRVNQWGHFHKPGILWLGLSENPDALKGLYKQIKKIVMKHLKGVSNNDFKPHISLLRNVKSLPQVNDFEVIDWHVNSFALVESKLHSDGVEYTVLKEWGE